MEIREGVYTYFFDGMLPNMLPGETSEEAETRISNLQLFPIIQQLNTKVKSFKIVVQVLASDATRFPTFSEFQASHSNPLFNTASVFTPIPNVLFNSPPPTTTTLVGKSKAAKPIMAPKAKRAKVAKSSPMVDLIEEDPPQQLSTGVSIQEEMAFEPEAARGVPPHNPISPLDFLNIRMLPPHTHQLPPC